MGVKNAQTAVSLPLGESPSVQGANVDKSGNWRNTSYANNLINRPKRIIFSWLVDQTTSTPKRNGYYGTIKYIQANGVIRDAKNIRNKFTEIF